MSAAPTPEQPRSDRGSTLIEMLISILVMGVISVSLLSVVATFLRNDAVAEELIDESRDLQQISVYLPSDVSSAYNTELKKDTNTGDGYLDANDPATPVGCPGYTGTGTNVLNLRWAENFGGTTKQFRVSYRKESVGLDTRIVRVACSGVTLGAPTTLIVARQLDSTAPVAVVLNPPMVTITLTEKTGRTLTLSATSQNPNQELEITTDYDD